MIGSHADTAVLSGGGSAQVIPIGGPVYPATYPCPPCWSAVVGVPSSPMNAIKAQGPGVRVDYEDGRSVSSAAALAAAAEVAIVFVNQWASEGMDLDTLNLTDLTGASVTDENTLVTAVAKANPRTVVVLETGGAALMPWLPNVSAVLEAWYPGQRGGEAIANLLFGTVNPSGKLPMTFPASQADLPRPQISMPPDAQTPFDVNYTIDGYNVGYKWYDAKALTPLFPFGFGLSYTSFSISNATLQTAAGPRFDVTFDVQNTGWRAGAEVGPVYLALPASTAEAKRLVGWQKVQLAAGEKQRVTISVDSGDSSHPFSYWDTVQQSWRIPSGTYTVYLGNSSANTSNVGSFNIP